MKAKERKGSSELNCRELKILNILNLYEIVYFMPGQQQLKCKTVSISMAILSQLIRQDGKRKVFETDHMQRALWCLNGQFAQKDFD